MHKIMYEKFLAKTFSLEISESEGDLIKSGALININDSSKTEIRGYIPRFCDDGYCDSFGMQWSRFKDLQIDSKTGNTNSYDRLTKSTKWDLSQLKGKSILECGCGPGRFSEIFLKAGANLVSVDMSRAVDANLENNGKRDNFLIMQCDITGMPFFYNQFDYVFCYGVLQHTRDPRQTFMELTRYVKPGGAISVDIYRKRFIPAAWTTPKYIWRPFTTRMDKEKLLKLIQWYIPKYIGFDTLIRRIPKIGIVLTGLIPIPCWNYVKSGYTREERIQHAIMDTFDALSPVYDKPATTRQLRQWLEQNPYIVDFEISGGHIVLVANAAKK
jgi:SAM-dependent methyltransferase